MILISSDRITEIIAKRECIERATNYFVNNSDEYFVSVRARWSDCDSSESGFDEVVVRREILSMFYGCDIVRYAKLTDRGLLKPKSKSEIFELWEVLKKNAPDDCVVDKSIKLSEEIIKKIRENGEEKS